MNRTRRSRKQNAVSTAIDTAFDWLRERIRGATGFIKRPTNKGLPRVKKMKSHPSISRRQTSAASTQTERRINKSTGRVINITIDNEDTIKIKDGVGMCWNSTQAANRPLGNPMTNDPEFGWWASRIFKYKINSARLIIQPIAATSQAITYDEEGDGVMTPIYLPRIKFLLSTGRTQRLPLGLEYNPVTYVMNPNLKRVQVQNYTFHNSILFDQVEFDWCAPNVEYFTGNNIPYLYISGNFSNSQFVDGTVIAKVRLQFFITAVAIDTIGNGNQSKQTSLLPFPGTIPEIPEDEAENNDGNDETEPTFKCKRKLSQNKEIHHPSCILTQDKPLLSNSISELSSQFSPNKESSNDA